MQKNQQKLLLALVLLLLSLVWAALFFYRYGQMVDAKEAVNTCIIYRIDCDRDKLQEAIELYEEKRESNDLRQEDYFWLMQAYLIIHSKQQAIDLLLEAKERFPDEIGINVVLAGLYRGLGDNASFKLYGNQAFAQGFQQFNNLVSDGKADSVATDQLLNIYWFLYPNYSDDKRLLFYDSLLTHYPENAVLLDYKEDILYRKALETGDTAVLPPH